MRGRAGRAGLGLTAIAALAVAVGPPLAGAGGEVPAAGQAAKKTTVKVGDDFYAPANLTIKQGNKVKWKWLAGNGNPHNVVLQKAPKKVKKKDFKSATGSIGIKFARKFKKPGRYDFICTIHSTVMVQTIKVKKKG